MVDLKEALLIQKEDSNQRELEKSNLYSSLIKVTSRRTKRNERTPQIFSGKIARSVKYHISVNASNSNVVSYNISKSRQQELIVSGFKFLIPSDFGHLKAAIVDSSFILNLEDNWDEEGATAVPTKIWERAITFLINYNNYLLDTYDVLIDTPHISPCTDGSIDVYFKNTNTQLLLNFRNSDLDEVHFYGDELNNYSKFKGNFLSCNFQEIISIWLKKFKLNRDGRSMGI